MTDHFIFTEDEWLGEGKIQLSMSQEPLYFVTRWKRQSVDASGHIEFVQEVQIKGINEMMINHFTFLKPTGKDRGVILENNTLGKVQGVAVIKPEVIGWEFNNPQLHFQGFEFYERLNQDQYHMRAEYASDEDFRTVISGKIWKKKKL